MNEERTTAYLLDELPEHEAEQFEEQYFLQPEWPDVELESAEDELIQAYVKNELSPERARRFEENYMTTEARIERVLFARSFLRTACTANQSKSTWIQKVLDFLKSLVSTPQFPIPKLATILLTVGLAATLLLFTIRTRPPQTFAQLNLAISTDTRRNVGAPVPKVTLPLPEDALRIWLTLPEAGPQGASYRVQWDNVKGRIGDLDIEKQEANAVSVIIPAGKLTSGQYVLLLFRRNPNGTEERISGSYHFEVVE